MAKLTGFVKHVIYSKKDYHVFAFLDQNLKEHVVVVRGNPPHVTGEMLDLVGNYTTHPKYGKQFNALMVLAYDTPTDTNKQPPKVDKECPFVYSQDDMESLFDFYGNHYGETIYES